MCSVLTDYIDLRGCIVGVQMFEAKLAQSSLLKKVLDALRELVEDTNLDCNSSGTSRRGLAVLCSA